VRYYGTIKQITDIEALIRSGRGWRYVKDYDRQPGEIQGKEFSSAVFTRDYEVFMWPYMFVIRLFWDYREASGRGSISVKNNNIHILLNNMPQLQEILSEMHSSNHSTVKDLVSEPATEQRW